MSEDWKKVLVIVGASFLIYIIFKPKKAGSKGIFSQEEKREPITKPTVDEAGMGSDEVKKAYEVLCAYIDAYNDGMSDEGLDKLKKDFKTETGIEIYTGANGKLAAKDDQGDILKW